MTQLEVQRRPRVVIVGAGFAGLAAARRLAGAPLDITVIDRRNYHLFQPLLYQVATGGLSPAQIAQPIRAILRDARNTRVIMARVDAIDRDQRRVLTDDGQSLPYDFLVVATGARHAYFGNDRWADVAPGLKKIDDAIEIRRRILSAFERAESSSSACERERLLTFIVVGGGPTGVEMAGAIAELARHTLRHDFRTIDPRDTRIVLVESGPRLLASFPPDLSEAARQSLIALGVEVRLGQPVTQCDTNGATVGRELIAAATIIWGAGVAASAAARWLQAAKDRLGRTIVNQTLNLPGHPEIFVIGDTAAAQDGNGQTLPGLAPVAKQQGDYVGRAIIAAIRNRPPPAPFRYRNFGTLATIGRGAAVARFGRLQFAGPLAWLLWAAIHVYFLVGFRNRLTVSLDWLWSYFTFQSRVRLITGPSPTPPPMAATPTINPAAAAAT